MTKITLTISITVLLVGSIVACNSTQPDFNSPVSTVDRSSLQASTSPSPATASTAPSPIRSIDFSKIALKKLSKSASSKRSSDTSRQTPTFIRYGDVTGDGVEEAMVVLSVSNRGSAILYDVYICSLEKNIVTVLWEFEPGDRADGGLRQVYAENGELVVELFGADRVIGNNLYIGDEGLCCPSSFTKTRYSWTGRNFRQIDKSVLKNPELGANPIMTVYTR